MVLPGGPGPAWPLTRKDHALVKGTVVLTEGLVEGVDILDKGNPTLDKGKSRPPTGGGGGGLLYFLGQFVILFVSARISCVSATYQLCISVSAFPRS